MGERGGDDILSVLCLALVERQVSNFFFNGSSFCEKMDFKFFGVKEIYKNKRLLSRDEAVPSCR